VLFTISSHLISSHLISSHFLPAFSRPALLRERPPLCAPHPSSIRSPLASTIISMPSLVLVLGPARPGRTSRRLNRSRANREQSQPQHRHRHRHRMDAWRFPDSNQLDHQPAAPHRCFTRRPCWARAGWWSRDGRACRAMALCLYVHTVCVCSSLG